MSTYYGFGHRYDVHTVANAAERELLRACERFAPMHSPHEGIAVILEEYRELEREVFTDRGRSDAAGTEAIQIAAMAMRYVLDLRVVR